MLPTDSRGHCLTVLKFCVVFICGPFLLQVSWQAPTDLVISKMLRSLSLWELS